MISTNGMMDISFLVMAAVAMSRPGIGNRATDGHFHLIFLSKSLCFIEISGFRDISMGFFQTNRKNKRIHFK